MREGRKVFRLDTVPMFIGAELHLKIFPGDYSGGVTPVTIPNTVVKPSSPDGIIWVTVWESRTLPGNIKS